MPTVSVKNLTVTYQNKHKKSVVALDNVSVDFASNAINVIVGYSGCGKTTLLKAICGLLDYDGDIFFDGLDVYGMAINKRNLAFVSQEYVLYPNITVFDNIAFPLTMTGANKQEIVNRVNEMAQKLKLTACLSRKPRYISGGQQQRVALARALIKRPSLCLLDEPLSNIDPQQRLEARVLIKSAIKQCGTTAIYVTHDFGEAMALADNLIVMDDKKIVYCGTPYDVYNNCNSELITAYKEAQRLW